MAERGVLVKAARFQPLHLLLSDPTVSDTAFGSSDRGAKLYTEKQGIDKGPP